jgi:murein DD-endopeptidase MepM/ murein hydrolase activator NlpD
MYLIKQTMNNHLASQQRVSPQRFFFLCVLSLIGCFGIYILTQNNSFSILTEEEERPVPLVSPVNSFVPMIKDPTVAPAGLWTSITVKAGDNLANIFKNLGLDHAQLDRILKTTHEKAVLTKLFPGQVLHFLIDNRQLQAIVHSLDALQTLYLFLENDAVRTILHKKEHETRMQFKTGAIESSLFESGKKHAIDTKLILQLSEIFGYDIDFGSHLRPNDHFRILFEEQYIDGKKINTGSILAAEFTNRGRTFKAIRFQDPDGKVGYYTLDGKSLQKGLLRTPVKFTRISSHFNMARRHPILHSIRAHKGIDYAAPSGTPVYAAADAKVHFAGHKGGYGKTIVLQHNKRFTTLYGHLSRFAPSLRAGQRVTQGQVIGYVGMTGRATGPHLHYETRIDGIHCNPLTLHLPHKSEVDTKYLPSFTAQAEKMWTLLERHHHVQDHE